MNAYHAGGRNNEDRLNQAWTDRIADSGDGSFLKVSVHQQSHRYASSQAA